MKPTAFFSHLLTLALASSASSYAALSVVTNLELHFDAGSITGLSNGDTVTDWADSSGNSRNLIETSSTADTSPTYQSSGIGGLPTVSFNGGGLASSFIGNAFTTTAGTTMFVVFKSTSSDVGTFISLNPVGGSSNQSFLYANRFSTGGLFGTFNASSGSPNSSVDNLDGPYNDGVGHLFTALTGTPDIILRADGGAETNSYTQGFNTTDIDAVTVGVLNNGTSSILTADVAEILVYGRTLSGAEVDSVEAHLMGKYSIVPEPSAALLSVLGLGIALARRRR